MKAKKTIAAIMALGLVSQFALMGVLTSDSSDSSVESNSTYMGNSDIALSNYSASGDSSAATPQEETETEEESTEVTVTEDTVTVKAESTVVGTVAVTTVSSEVVEKALEALLEAGGTIFAVEAAVSEEGAAQVVISTSSLATLAQSDVAVSIPSQVGTVALNSEVLTSILSQLGDGDVQIAIAKADTSTLNEAQLAAFAEKEDRPVFDFSVGTEGVALSDFGGATVELSIPVTLPEEVDTDSIVVLAIDGEGNVTELETSYVDGIVTFAAQSSAIFMIDYQ